MVDRGLFDKMPLEPVVVAEFAGHSGFTGIAAIRMASFTHGRSRRKTLFGGWPADHRPAKQSFLNQIPLDAVRRSRLSAARRPPAEFGEKASVVINVTTRSGQGMTTPHGSLTASYGKLRHIRRGA